MVNDINLSHRVRMESLESVLREMPDQYDFAANTKHYFAHGVYVRELFIPAGVMMTGKIHKNSSINIIVKGRIKVVTDEGDYEIEGYQTLITGPGVKKAVYAIEDTVWLNCLPWAGDPDPQKAEEVLTYDSYEAMEGPCLLVR